VKIINIEDYTENQKMSISAGGVVSISILCYYFIEKFGFKCMGFESNCICEHFSHEINESFAKH
jgi:hypothetical protein